MDDARDEEPRAVDGGTRNNRSIIVALAVVAAVALLAVAGLVGYILANRGADDAKSRDVGVAADVPDDEVPDLRPTAEAALAAGATAEQDGSVDAFRKWVDAYAVPACGEMLIGIAEAFGGGESEPKPKLLGYPKLVSLDQDGTTGVAVTRSAPSADPETIHWIYNGTEWRFTCEGVFDAGGDEATTVETTRASTARVATPRTTAAATPRETSEPTAVQESAPSYLEPCFAHEAGRQVGPVTCWNSDGSYKWEALPSSVPDAGASCNPWEYGQIIGSLLCMSDPDGGYVWLPGAN